MELLLSLSKGSSLGPPRLLCSSVRSHPSTARQGGCMRVDKIDQITINVKNLEESVKLFSDTLGITFLPTREVTVGGTRLRFAWSSLGLGLVESDPPEP